MNTLKYNEIHNYKSPKSRLDFKSRQPKLLMSDPTVACHRKDQYTLIEQSHHKTFYKTVSNMHASTSINLLLGEPFIC